ncbi:DEAD/DEAH box helicase [Gaeumannomyces tritici R3-111a-1]|uniref:DEAD/DEAH box helicase n=1 Tax=Gaeumannomyces tritici (strain R3-111a-1) TaxID=644352 RepID=J3NG97_GAET3|nr:DEAD/DEAH box helicase [Gaeumannomyces tritici R3-111a-1]EJT80287.1 DEAD/DEAH box helicase [Gaeumannomyces tritici R3-111a-1]
MAATELLDAAGTVQTWYSQRSGPRVDIVGDFAGNDLFAIHGESLMAQCISQAKVDYQDGFQLLHAVHAVEKFLADLERCGARFHVVWFSNQEQLCIPPQALEANHAKYHLTRAVLIEHLNRNAGSGSPKVSFEFPGLSSPEFELYLQESAVQCFVCSDGRPGPTDSPKDDERRQRCLDIIFRLNTHEYSIALLDGMVMTSSKVFTTVFSPQYSSELPLAQDKTSDCNEPRMSSLCYDVLSVPASHSWTKWEDGTALTAREALTVAALAELAGKTATLDFNAIAFLIHLVMLSELPLAHRRSPAPQKLEAQGGSFLSLVAEICVNTIKDGACTAAASILRGLEWDLFDMIDGRLFHTVSTRLDSTNLTDSAKAKLLQLAEKIDQLSPAAGCSKLACSLGQTIDQSEAAPSKDTPDSAQDVLPFSHPVLDDFFGGVSLEISSAPERVISTDIFREVSHWHNAKKKLGGRAKPRPLDFWARKRHQRLMADTISYAASLSGGSGATIKPETIFMVTSAPAEKAQDWKLALREKTASAAASKKAAAASKNAKNKKGKTDSPKDPRQAAAQKADLKTAAAHRVWDVKRKELEKVADLQKRLKMTELFESELLKPAQLHKPAMSEFAHDVSLYICKILAGTLKDIMPRAVEHESPESEEVMDHIWRRITHLRGQPLSESLSAELSEFAAALQGFTERAAADGKNTPGTSIEFQLERYGPYMERGFDSAPDPRVPFKPDAWQRKVLDAIDDNKSMCVIAPTSAGKTFISFYAMKKVMQTSDDGVLVYIAPTKALVNQIAAEIQARFAKTFKFDGRSVWAIHTRDTRVNNPTGCQVLVTVPEILEIMLLSTVNYEKKSSWAHRIKRIIFDEVHSIGQHEEGIIWEQLLLLAPCPIITLSATVSNPEDFKEWLVGSQSNKGFGMEMIVHNSRYSDLRKYIYTPPARPDPFQGLPRKDPPGTPELDRAGAPFAFVHPVAALINRHRGRLDDINLEARDCLTLWRSMKKHETPEFPVGENLAPSKALPAIVKKADVTRWETDLKARLLDWMNQPDSPFAAVQEELKVKLPQGGEGETRVPPPGETGNRKESGEAYMNDFYLLLDLHRQNALPAIIFNFDRDECMNTLSTVLNELEKAESEYKRTSKKWESKMDKFNEYKKTQAKRKPFAKSTAPADDDGATKGDIQRELAETETSSWAGFDPEAPLDDFSFANSSVCSRSELEELIWVLGRRGINNPTLINGLRRGIACHHEGLPFKYRQTIEKLCRRGYLTVVVATGTLALGINLPCKTAVFSGDSIFLSALNYRQAAGRAGRRGFDLLGNVVFNIPPQRAFEVMSSRLPDLRGQFALSTSLLLRVLALCYHTKNSDPAVQAAQSLLSQTRLYLGGPAGETAVKHHIRFSIEYLRRQHLLSQDGAPLNFAGLISHLYCTEDSSFAFHSLLKEGYFHQLCAEVESRRSEVLLELMLVMSHLFGRLPCDQYKDKEWLKKIKDSPSIVLLPPVPKAAHALLHRHNKETLETFFNYVQTFVRQHLSEVPDNELPFTKCRAGAAGAHAPGALTMVPGAASLPPGPKIRSPFAALSGFGDDFYSIHDLCANVRAGVFLDEPSVPFIPVYPEDTEGTPWNAYLYDFYMHGDLVALTRDNGIKKGDVWYLLKDFSLTLAKIITCLTSLIDPKSGSGDVSEIQDAQDRNNDVSEEKQIMMEDEQAATGEGGTAVSAADDDLGVRKKKGKAKALDSWEDGDDSDDDIYGGSGGEGEGGVPAWQRGDGRNLQNVLKTFVYLQQEFDEKFLKIWA